jgi:hypothetical protein
MRRRQKIRHEVAASRAGGLAVDPSKNKTPYAGGGHFVAGLL